MVSDVCSQARNLCAQHERTGALTLVARTDTWNSYPAHVTNAAQVAAGTHPPTYEARPTWDLPNAPAATAYLWCFPCTGTPWPGTTAAYAAATSTLAQALLASIGPDNTVSLETTFDPDPLYSLTPRQIVDAMFAEHGMTDPQDLAVLRAPLHEPLPALANLERHMNTFLLASKKLTTADHPVVGQCLPAYYALNTTMTTRLLGTSAPCTPTSSLNLSFCWLSLRPHRSQVPRSLPKNPRITRKRRRELKAARSRNGDHMGTPRMQLLRLILQGAHLELL